MRDELGRNGTGGAKGGIIKCFEILSNRTWRFTRINRLWVPVRLRRGLLTVGIGGNDDLSASRGMLKL